MIGAAGLWVVWMSLSAIVNYVRDTSSAVNPVPLPTAAAAYSLSFAMYAIAAYALYKIPRMPQYAKSGYALWIRVFR